MLVTMAAAARARRGGRAGRAAFAVVAEVAERPVVERPQARRAARRGRPDRRATPGLGGGGRRGLQRAVGRLPAGARGFGHRVQPRGRPPASTATRCSTPTSPGSRCATRPIDGVWSPGPCRRFGPARGRAGRRASSPTTGPGWAPWGGGSGSSSRRDGSAVGRAIGVDDSGRLIVDPCRGPDEPGHVSSSRRATSSTCGRRRPRRSAFRRVPRPGPALTRASGLVRLCHPRTATRGVSAMRVRTGWRRRSWRRRS